MNDRDIFAVCGNLNEPLNQRWWFFLSIPEYISVYYKAPARAYPCFKRKRAIMRRMIREGDIHGD
jgi:hypothetical protein